MRLPRAKQIRLLHLTAKRFTDNSQIPGALRGYVQVAIDKGLFEAFPAEVIQIAPGQFQVLPGPRFEPNTTVTRATLANKLNVYRGLFSIGG